MEHISRVTVNGPMARQACGMFQFGGLPKVKLTAREWKRLQTGDDCPPSATTGSARRIYVRPTLKEIKNESGGNRIVRASRVVAGRPATGLSESDFLAWIQRRKSGTGEL
jgi:hypothetical protein